MHQVGEIFIETVTEVAYDPVAAEESDQLRVEDPIHLAQDMRFKATIRGRRRSLRISNRDLAAGVYCELNEDVDMNSDDDLEQDFQQGYLCVSADPRRVRGPGGELTIINLKELRTLLYTQQPREDQTV